MEILSRQECKRRQTTQDARGRGEKKRARGKTGENLQLPWYGGPSKNSNIFKGDQFLRRHLDRAARRGGALAEKDEKDRGRREKKNRARCLFQSEREPPSSGSGV